MTQTVPTNKIDDLVRRLAHSAGSNLESVILYGSAVSGDFDPELSNVNILCVLHDSSFARLQALAPVIKWWNGRRQPTPLFMTRQELTRSADVFAIELLDMRQHYRVLLGQDVLQNLEIPLRLHRIQVEYELREKLLLLRQKMLLAADRKRQLSDLLLRSLPSFLTLFRHALIALGEVPPFEKREAVQSLARRLGFDSSLMNQLLDAREHKADLKKMDIQDLFAGYLKTIEQVATAVDTMLDADRSGRS